MKRIRTSFFVGATIFVLALASARISHSEGNAAAPATDAGVQSESDELTKAKEALKAAEETPTDEKAEAPAPAKVEKRKGMKIERADSFVAGPDWEFDGFVAGGQDQNSKSLFYLTDLVYLNIGAAQGLKPGDKVNLYKRGDRIRDPQTGKFIGYEVRRAALSEVTDKIDDQQCAARILATFEGVEIGDLVRRAD